MATFTNETKNTSTFTNTNKSQTLGLWDALTFPWMELLPWQFTSPGYPTFTNQTKN